MIKGVTKDEEYIIQNILSPYKKDFDFFYYGSRVKGNFEKTSDLDILIKGDKEISFNTLDMLKVMFDNSDLPYIVNFTDFHNIENRFYKFIEKDLVKV